MLLAKRYYSYQLGEVCFKSACSSDALHLSCSAAGAGAGCNLFRFAFRLLPASQISQVAETGFRGGRAYSRMTTVPPETQRVVLLLAVLCFLDIKQKLNDLR